MWGNKGKRKNALTLVGLEPMTPGQEAQVLTIRPLVPLVSMVTMLNVSHTHSGKSMHRGYLVETLLRELGVGGVYICLNI